jgi:hypothetical protein
MRSASPTILRLTSLVVASMLALHAKAEEEVPIHPYPNVLPAQVDRFIAEGKFELLSLDPTLLTDKQRRRLKGKLFNGYRVLGRVEIPKGPQRDQLLQALHDSLANAGYALAYCFDPRHAIRASVGAETVDLLICFECDKILLHPPGTSFVSIGKGAQAAFDEALKRAGVPLGKRP